MRERDISTEPELLVLRGQGTFVRVPLDGNTPKTA